MENNYRLHVNLSLSFCSVFILGGHGWSVTGEWQKTGKVGGLWGMRDRNGVANGTDSLKNLLLSRSSYDWENHQGKVCKIRACLTHTELCILSAQCDGTIKSFHCLPPEIKITDFTDRTVRGPFLQQWDRQIAFNDLIITQEICLFLYLIAVFFYMHLSVWFPSLKKYPMDSI